jgi:uncharacterized protein DUF3617
MSFPVRIPRLRGLRPAILLAVTGLIVAASAAARADDAPSFRQGLWEYQRSAGTDRFAATECLNPAEELRRHQTALQKIGCKLSPTAHAGSTWTYSADCTVKLPSGAVAFSTTSVLTADSDTAYQVETRTTNQGRTTSEVINAHRVTDCTN